jgi:pimeloyl-ACP methyl ester carboxylesterase
VIFIPGNPGLISYYQEFLSNLQDSLPNEEVKESLEIYSIGHLGHCLQTQEGGRGFKPKDQASLQEQVESKIEFLDELKEKYNIQHHQDDDDEQVKIIVMGHSIGSWICLQVSSLSPLVSFLSRLTEFRLVVAPFVFILDDESET